MKINSTKNHLQEVMVLSEKTAGHNLTLPVLNAVLIQASKNKLNFITTNLETALEISVSSKIEKEGNLAIPAKLLSNLISSLSQDQTISLSASNNNLVLTTSNSSTTIKGYPVEDFPVIPKVKEKYSFSILIKDFLSGLKSVYYSASLSEMKPELNSIYVFFSKPKSLVFAATDSFRLSEKSVVSVFNDIPGFLIPYKSVSDILRVFEKEDGLLKINIDENNICLSSDRLNFISRLIEGSFPDYQQIIPSSFLNSVVVSKKNLTAALKTSAMFCGKLNEVKVKIYEGEKFIEFQTNNSDLGEHFVKIEGKVEGGGLNIVFNHRYLFDVLNSIHTENILLKFAGEGKALLITSLDDSTFRYLVMPMKDV